MNTSGLSSAQAEQARLRDGWNEVAPPRPKLWLAFLSRFWGPSAWMIESIALLSWLLRRPSDGRIALLLLALNAVISFFQERRAERAVELLKSKLQVTARVLRDGSWASLPARELVAGDVIRLRLGDIIPADVRVVEGEAEIDQSALTGESAEVRRKAGEQAYSGSLVRRGECTGEVTATGERSYFGRTIELVQTAKPKLHLDEIVGKLTRWLALAVGVILAVTTAAALMRGVGLADVLPLALVLLMGAVPVALPVMFSVSTAVAARDLGERGVLVTRLSAAEDAATMDTLCVDKTGTMTENRLSVARLAPVEGVEERELLLHAALASDAADRDPIDMAILAAAQDRIAEPGRWRRERFVPFSPELRRTEADATSPEGARVTTTKGSVAAVSEWASSDPAAASAEQSAEDLARTGCRAIAVALRGPGPTVRYLGLIGLQDPPRADSKSLLERLKGLGVRVRMLTGDARPAAQLVADQIGLGEIASSPAPGADLGELIERSDGLAGVYPETKLRVIEALQARGRVVGMTGDGVNDAPSLKKAEVGIAVSAATDAAKAAASVVLTTEGLSGIVDLVENGRAVYQRILTWMINKVSRTVFKAGFVVAAYFLTGRFVISAVGLLTVVLMTDFAKIALATDRVRPSSAPDTWKVGRLAAVGAALGVLMTLEALFLLALGVHHLGLAPQSRRLHTYVFVILLFMALFSILSIRERRSFWSSRPSAWLLAALGGDAIIGLMVALKGFGDLPALPMKTVAVAASGSALFALAVNDFAKRALLRALKLSRLKGIIVACNGLCACEKS